MSTGSTAQVISWGGQHRVRCPDCQVIIGTGQRVTCKRCGAVFVQNQEKVYEREASV